MSMILRGDARKIPLEDESVHCVITSPPYWGLRKYDIPDVVFDGDEGCEHEWGDEIQGNKFSGGIAIGIVGSHQDNSHQDNRTHHDGKKGSFCLQCSAWRGQLGLEPTPELFVKHLVEIFREVKRVLRKDGTLWLNLGDSYWSDTLSRKDPVESMWGNRPASDLSDGRNNIPSENSRGGLGKRPSGFKPKDLSEIPSDVVRALRADGWYLRSRIPWLKRNSMPESVTDRPATSVEYVFLLSKSKNYFYDREAVKMLQQPSSKERAKYGWAGRTDDNSSGARTGSSFKKMAEGSENKTIPADGRRNLRNSDFFFQTWQGLLINEEGEPLALIVNPKGYKEAHFAVFPEKLAEPMVKAGTSEKGCCPKCGGQWERVVEHKNMVINRSSRTHERGQTRSSGTMVSPHITKTLGWQPTCECKNRDAVQAWGDYDAPVPPFDPIPCTVLDPFAGSGTTVKVAIALNRKGIGLDLGYLDLSRERIRTIEREWI